MKKVSKAQLKREKQLRERLNYRLNNLLKNFKNNYLRKFVNFRIREIERKMEHTFYLEENWEPRSKWDTKPNYEAIRKGLQETLDRESLLTLKFINEGNDNYTHSLNKLIAKLVKYEINSSYWTLKQVYNEISNEFSFLVENDTIEVEARLIFAEGPVNAPHYRFITTKRNKVVENS